MHARMRMVLGLVGILILVAMGLPVWWHQSDSSGSRGLNDAMAGDDVIRGAAQEMLDAAKQYEAEAERHEAEARRYEQKSAAITPLMDPKGFRRDALKIAADSHRAMANELRFHAKTYRVEAELMVERAKGAEKEK